jgi:hypothetical protein
MIRRTSGVVALGAGLAVISVVTALAPAHAPPLYDGVAITEPYRYLSPQPGQAGDPTSATVTSQLDKGTSPAFAAATSEIPPQAQLIVPAGAFSPAPGATAITVTIVPIAPAVAGPNLGNAYRISAVDQAGAPVPITNGSQPTLVLRAPPGAAEVAIEQLVDGRWTETQTQVSGQADSFMTTVDTIGDFALEGSAPSSGFGLDPRYLLAGGLIAFGVILALLVLWQGRSRPDEADPVPQRSAIPRKRRRGRRR